MNIMVFVSHKAIMKRIRREFKDFPGDYQCHLTDYGILEITCYYKNNFCKFIIPNDYPFKPPKPVWCGTTDITDEARQRINSGQVTMDTKPVKFEKGKDISLKMKRGSDLVTGVEFPKETIDADGNIETASDMKKRFIRFIKNRVKFSQKGLTGTGFANADIAEEFPISERQGGRLARYFIDNLGLKYAKGKRTASSSAYETYKTIMSPSSIKEEGRLTSIKTPILKERDLAYKIDKAHRISKTHMYN